MLTFLQISLILVVSLFAGLLGYRLATSLYN